MVELVTNCVEFLLQLRLQSCQRTPSSNLGPVHLFRWEALVSHLERLPQGNLWCESCPFLSQHKVTWPSGRIVPLPYMFILLLVRQIYALGNSFLKRLLGMVLQVDAESICTFTTFVFSPCIRCRFAKYFVADCGVVSHSITMLFRLCPQRQNWIAAVKLVVVFHPCRCTQNGQ